jgi:protein ImuA
MTAASKKPEAIHSSLWRASQLGRASGRVVETGYAALSAELPGGGWPLASMVELLPQQPGIGELRLIAPALSAVAARPVAFLQPPQIPNAAGLAYIGIPSDKVLYLPVTNTSDALWAAEQILRAGSCGALLCWQKHMRHESLRRLVLAARTSEILLFMIRPLACAADASPAELRLALRPIERGVSIDLIKRKGPTLAAPIDIELRPQASLISQRGKVSRVRPTRELVELAPV